MRRLTFLLAAILLLTACAVQPEPAAVTQPPVITAPVTQPTQPTQQTEPPATTEPAPETQPTEAPIPRQEAQPVMGLSVLQGGQDVTGLLTDANVYSKTQITAEQSLTVESTQVFSSLYLIWDAIPGSYTLEWDGGSIRCGENGFLHEYVTLPEVADHVQITFAEENTRTLCDISAYTEGYAPADVQIWQPPCEEADILVFPTHSDDDAIFFGALLSYYAVERRLTVQTAFMVDHVWQPHRAHERLNGLWAMGIRHYPILGSAPDTATFDFQEAMSLYYSSDILGWQVEQIRRFKPLVVVGHDLNGEYGNAGHKVNAHYLTQAITAAADPEQYPKSAHDYGVWQAPKLYLHLYRENEIYLEVNTPMENDPLGRTPFEAAQDGFAAHVSQQRWAQVQQNDANRAYDCRPFGLYFTLVGTDTTADIMEHVDREAWLNRDK